MLPRQLLSSSRRAVSGQPSSQFRPRRTWPASFFKEQIAGARRQSSTQDPSTRVDRIVSRLPRPLRRYTNGLRNAPLSHVVAFLVLHEITAIVPLLGLWGVFHYTDYIPLSYVTRHWGLQVRDGVARAERYFRRKGWFGFGDDVDEQSPGRELTSTGTETEEVKRRWARTEGPVTGEANFSYTQSTAEASRATEEVLERWASDGKYRVVVEVALAWAITKALLPVRIVFSVWATPWAAGAMGRARRIFRR
jgi:hypothetical protein